MITADLVIANLAANSKKQVLSDIAAKAVDLFHGDQDVLLQALMERERIGSTGIGCGVAIPHIKITGVHKMYGILARLQKPVDYDSIDGNPVDIIFMLLAPSDSKTTQHLKFLAQASRFLRDEDTCIAIRNANDENAIVSLFKEWAEIQPA